MVVLAGLDPSIFNLLGFAVRNFSLRLRIDLL
jgi:hypothetical protein